MAAKQDVLVSDDVWPTPNDIETIEKFYSHWIILPTKKVNNKIPEFCHVNVRGQIGKLFIARMLMATIPGVFAPGKLLV